MACTWRIPGVLVPGARLKEKNAVALDVWRHDKPDEACLAGIAEEELQDYLDSDAYRGREIVEPFCSCVRAWTIEDLSGAPLRRLFLIQFSFEGFVDAHDDSVAIGTVFFAWSSGKKQPSFDVVQRLWTAQAPF